MKKPVKVVVTGAAGQIGYSLLFRIGAGDMLGTDQPIDLMMLERNNEQSLKNSRGVQMELDDCAFPLLNSITATSDPYVCFKDAEIALLVGSRPRTADMQRADLLAANAQIFVEQGKAMNEVADRNIMPDGLYARRAGRETGAHLAVRDALLHVFKPLLIFHILCILRIDKP